MQALIENANIRQWKFPLLEPHQMRKSTLQTLPKWAHPVMRDIIEKDVMSFLTAVKFVDLGHCATEIDKLLHYMPADDTDFGTREDGEVIDGPERRMCRDWLLTIATDGDKHLVDFCGWSNGGEEVGGGRLVIVDPDTHECEVRKLYVNCGGELEGDDLRLCELIQKEILSLA